MSDSFTLRVEGQDQVERALFALIGKVADMTPLMDIIGTYLESDAQDNFIGEHSPAGVPWLPSGRVRRTAVGKQGPQRPTGKTLQDSRRLFLSLTRKTDVNHVREVKSHSVEVGTNVVYARRHNQGWNGTEQVKAHNRVLRQVFGVKLKEARTVTVKAHSRKANTPKREFLGMSPGVQQDILGEIADYLGAAQ